MPTTGIKIGAGHIGLPTTAGQQPVAGTSVTPAQPTSPAPTKAPVVIGGMGHVGATGGGVAALPDGKGGIIGPSLTLADSGPTFLLSANSDDSKPQQSGTGVAWFVSPGAGSDPNFRVALAKRGLQKSEIDWVWHQLFDDGGNPRWASGQTDDITKHISGRQGEHGFSWYIDDYQARILATQGITPYDWFVGAWAADVQGNNEQEVAAADKATADAKTAVAAAAAAKLPARPLTPMSSSSSGSAVTLAAIGGALLLVKFAV